MKSKVITFGCRLNACESETIEEFLKELEIDDFTIINTCTVTAEAERKLRQTIRRLYNEDNKIKIILTGCAAELNPDFYINMEGVVGIISNKIKLSKSEYKKYSCSDDNNQRQIISERTKIKKIRGFLQIQNGCDQKCTYCIVRTTRGANISFNEDDIVEQTKNLIKKGYKDIILTGVNISAYGRDMNPRKNLAYIVNYILKNVSEIKRLGLSSLDPADIDNDLIKIIGNEERLLPHIHESIQSGDDLILKRMMRRHSHEQVVETNTKKLMKDAHITLLHAFPFSKRPGTPAAQMPGVDRKIARERVRELKTLAQEMLYNKLHEYIGKNVNILAEDSKNAKTNSFLKVISTEKIETGKEYLFRCEKIENDHLVGRPIEEKI